MISMLLNCNTLTLFGGVGKIKMIKLIKQLAIINKKLTDNYLTIAKL